MNVLTLDGRSVEEKKKMLWGNKAKVTTTTAPSSWQETAQMFVDSDQQNKFLKLIGVKEGQEDPTKGNEAGANTSTPQSAQVTDELLARQAQIRHDLEQQYALGLRHNISRTGLY